ncbi:MAG: hypothetical protein ABI697_08935 [Devosia sp.]
MAKTTKFVRATDVGFWGIVTIAIWGFALVSGVIQPLIPGNLLAGLHASRMDAGNLNRLRADFADLQSTAAELKTDNSQLRQRVALSEDTAAGMTKRVVALELSMPRVIEAVNAASQRPVDTTSVTASTGKTGSLNGPIKVTTIPYHAATFPIDASGQPMPATLEATASPQSNPGAYGIALGPPILESDGAGAWQEMTSRVGTLLVGLGPILADVEGAPGKRLLAGPLPSEAAARELCGSMAKMGIACATLPFVGDPVR